MQPQRVFEILVREHAGMLDVFLRAAVRDPGLVDDLFQETIVRAWRRLDAFDPTRPFAPWLRGIARKLVLEQARRSPRLVALDSEEALAELDGRCDRFAQLPGDTLDERLEQLRGCLDELNEPHRAAVRARYEEDLRGSSLAERLSTGVENARKLVQRARRRLAECIERQRAGEATS